MFGDEIKWEIRFFSKARINNVWATFVKDGHTARPRTLVLGGTTFNHEQTTEGRIASAALSYTAEYSSKQLEVGDYHLRDIEGVTASGNRFNFELPATSPILRMEPDPPGEDKPRLMENNFRVS